MKKKYSLYIFLILNLLNCSPNNVPSINVDNELIYTTVLSYIRYEPMGLYPPESVNYDSTRWAEIRKNNDKLTYFIISKLPLDLRKFSFENQDTIPFEQNIYIRYKNTNFRIQDYRIVTSNPNKFQLRDNFKYPFPDTVITLNGEIMHPIYLKLSEPLFKNNNHAIIFTESNTFNTVYEFRVFYLQNINNQWKVTKDKVLGHS